MSTSTAGNPAGPGQCLHKLPTACKLTATLNCCACADTRPHASSYSIYIDGVGYVSRGTRWENYCWCCKGFWTVRVEAAGLSLQPSQTQIPDRPDQQGFFQDWYDCYRGYTEVRAENGDVGRVPILCEPVERVAPGHLPRRIDGHASDQRDNQDPAGARSEYGPNWFEDMQLERIARLMEEIRQFRERLRSVSSSMEEFGSREVNEASYASSSLERRLQSVSTNLRRQQDQLEARLNGGSTEGVGPAGVTTTTPTSGNSIPPSLQRQLGHAYRSYVAMLETSERETRREIDARATLDDAQERAELAQEGLNAAVERIRRLEDERRTHEEVARIFGTREEMEQLGADYVSPIGGMFTRAWNRYHQREEERTRDQILHEVLSAEDRYMAEQTDHDRIMIIEEPVPNDDAVHANAEPGSGDEGWGSLDMQDDGRPPPLEEAAINVTLTCKICYTQMATIAVIPCGHCVMCQWCADTHIPSHKHDRTRPAKKSTCPLCRTPVKRKARLHFS